MSVSRWLALGLLLLVGALAAPAAALAAGETVTVVGVDGREREVTLTSLQPDVQGRTYTTKQGKQQITGVSLGAVLRQAGIDARSFTTIDVSSFELTADEATSPSAFPDGPPVFVSTPEGWRYLQPSRIAGRAAANVTASSVTARRKEFTVHGEASPSAPKAGEEVTLTAVADGVLAGQRPRFSWMVDGDRKSGREVSHRFERKGTYRVLLSAFTDDRPEGVFATVVVRVGAAAEKKEPEPAPEAVTPSQGGTGGSGTGLGQGGGGSGSTGSDTSGLPVAPSPVAPSQPAPVTPPPQPTPKPRPTPKPPPQPAGSTVDGVLLESLAVAPPQPASGPRAGRRKGKQKDDGLHVPVAVWGLLGAGALLGFGWVLEGRHTLPYWP